MDDIPLSPTVMDISPMPHISGAGYDDVIEIDSGDFADRTGTMALQGGGNVVRIGAGVQAVTLKIRMLGAASLTIAGHSALGHLDIYLSNGASLAIGSECAFNGSVNLYQHEASSMTIGRNCLFGGGALLTTSDMHSIISLQDSQRINPAKDIAIEERVWLGAGVTVLKGVTVGEGSAIGAHSVVSRSVRRNCLVAGNPAALVREGITWRPDLI